MTAGGGAEAAEPRRREAPGAPLPPDHGAGGSGSARSGDGAPPGARFAALLALATLGVAQPLFDLLGRNAAFFVAHRATAADLVLLALLPTLGIAGLLLVIEELGGRMAGNAMARALHLCFVAVLGAPLGLLAAQRLPALPAVAAVVAAAASGIGVAWLARTRTGGTFLAVAGVLSLLLPLHFLLLTPVRRLLLPAPAVGATGGVWRELSGRELPVARKPFPVVMLVFDELPLSSLLDSQGRIAARRFPNFAAVAARSTWYRRATAVSGATQLAVPALLTGAYPPAESLPALADHPHNLFTLLAGSHHVTALESLTHLCPRAVCGDGRREGSAAGRLRSLFGDARVVYLHLVLPRAWAAELPGIEATWSGFARREASERQLGGEAPAADADGRRRDLPRQVATFLAAVDRGAAEKRPGLYYLHLELPHIPWRFLPDGREYGPISASFFADGVNADSTWRDDDWLLAQGAQRHLLQLAYADRVLGELVAGLRQRGLAERALLVVTADHGIAFVAGEPGRRVTAGNYAEVLSVPLFVALPGQRTGAVDDRPVRQVDVLPTIADALGIEPLPWPVDGGSLLRPGALAGRDDVVAVDGGLRRFPLAGLPAAERRAVDRLAGWFGDDRPAAQLLALGTRPGLAGRPLAALRPAPRPAAAVALEQPWFLDRVEPGSGFVPARVVGRLLPLPGGAGVADRTELAVAVNGVVRATTRSFRDGAAVRFAALVPEESFLRGRNVVEVLVVAPGEPPRLAPTVDHSGPRYRLRRRAGGEVAGIEATNGTQCTLDPRAVAGGLVPEDWYVGGWAQPAGREWPLAVIMVFVGDELTHVVTTGSAPPAGSSAAGVAGRERTGFRFTVPESLRGGLAPADGGAAALRVFAVAGERCSELRFEPGR